MRKTKTKLREERPSGSPSGLSTLLRDVLGVLFLAGILYLTLSLLSYHPDDPSFNRRLVPVPPAQNLGGYPGAYLADILVTLFGAGAYLLLLTITLASWAFLRGKKFGRPARLVILGGGFSLISICGLLNLLFYEDFLFSDQSTSGGLLGELIALPLLENLNLAGAYLVLSTFFFLSLVLATPLNLAQLFRFIGNLVRLFFSGKTLSPFRPGSRVKNKNFLEDHMGETLVKDMVALPIESTSSYPVRVGEVEATTFSPETSIEKATGEMKGYQLPPINLLTSPPSSRPAVAEEELRKKGEHLEGRLKDFGIHGKVTQILQGPVITTYEFEPVSGIKVSRIMSLSDDLALAMKALSVRILAPVPRKAVVGIEIPNDYQETVCLSEIISSQAFKGSDSKLTLVLGKDILGKPVVTDLAQIPHLLIAGATGSGKSVGLNSMICSILFNTTPEEVRLIMIDPKMLELSIYDGIPHLISPVVTDPKKAAAALKWAVGEMEKRYKLMAEKGVRNIKQYNQSIDEQTDNVPPPAYLLHDEASELPLPDRKLQYIVVVIDELADLMMISSKDVEDSLARLAQMARAAGIHLIVATQRPSVDVLTGVIKANFPARISFQVSSRIDSRTILDAIGGEKLLGNGDLLFLPPGTSRLERVHGAFVSEKEIKRIVGFLKQQQVPVYDDSVLQSRTDERELGEEEDYDEKYEEAIRLVAQTSQASISMIQRRLRIGYNRAARIIEFMEREGLVGPSDGFKPREVHVKKEDFL